MPRAGGPASRPSCGCAPAGPAEPAGPRRAEQSGAGPCQCGACRSGVRVCCCTGAARRGSRCCWVTWVSRPGPARTTPPEVGPHCPPPLARSCRGPAAGPSPGGRRGAGRPGAGRRPGAAGGGARLGGGAHGVGRRGGPGRRRVHEQHVRARVAAAVGPGAGVPRDRPGRLVRRGHRPVEAGAGPAALPRPAGGAARLPRGATPGVAVAVVAPWDDGGRRCSRNPVVPRWSRSSLR